MYRIISCAAILLAFLAGCSAFVSAPKNVQTGQKVVCILYNETAFKNRVVALVQEKLSSEGYAVVTDRVKRAKYYPADRYGAVVYMAEYLAWHVPFHQKRYFSANGKAGNIVLLTTSGDPDMRIAEPFDAITGASEEQRIEPVSSELMTRLDRILE